jgi:hypothetical protein
MLVQDVNPSSSSGANYRTAKHLPYGHGIFLSFHVNATFYLTTGVLNTANNKRQTCSTCSGKMLSPFRDYPCYRTPFSATNR